jgi:hypothetical protein
MQLVLSPAEAWAVMAASAMFSGNLAAVTPELGFLKKLGSSTLLAFFFGVAVWAGLEAPPWTRLMPLTLTGGLGYESPLIVVRPAALAFDDLYARVGALKAQGAEVDVLAKAVTDAGWTVPDYKARVAAKRAAAQGSGRRS